MNNNPMQILQMIRKGGNPQQIMLNLMEQQMSGTPMGDNLIQLAKNGNSRDIESIARNIFSQNGRDFDSEFNNFRNTFGL